MFAIIDNTAVPKDAPPARYVKEDAEKLREKLASLVPVCRVEYSSLGGAHRASLMVTVSFDAAETWGGGIFHNSRYAMFHVYHDGGIEQFGRSYHTREVAKFRTVTNKKPVANLDEVGEKLKKYLTATQTALQAIKATV